MNREDMIAAIKRRLSGQQGGGGQPRATATTMQPAPMFPQGFSGAPADIIALAMRNPGLFSKLLPKAVPALRGAPGDVIPPATPDMAPVDVPPPLVDAPMLQALVESGLVPAEPVAESGTQS